MKEPVVLVLSSTEAARRAARRAGLRYSVGVLREMGYTGAAHALQKRADELAVPVAPLTLEELEMAFTELDATIVDVLGQSCRD